MRVEATGKFLKVSSQIDSFVKKTFLFLNINVPFPGSDRREVVKSWWGNPDGGLTFNWRGSGDDGKSHDVIVKSF